MPHLFEVLEDRLAPAVIVLDSVRTTDSREAIVNYAITTSNLTQPFAIQIFRSDQPSYSSTDQRNVAVGEPFTVTDLSAGPHSITIELASPAPGEPSAPVEPLAPDPALPYVLAVADPQHTLPANVTIDESQGSFKIFVIADVSPGFGIIAKPEWVQIMVKALQIIGYDSVEPLDWNTSLPLPGQAVLAGNNLYAQILSQANGLQSKITGNDVIDVQLIGHSRGTSVVGWAMQDLVSQLGSAPDALQEGYFGLTLLDPHPANADTADEVSLVTTGIPVAGLTVIIANELLEQTYNDPPITVAGRVNQTDIYYQQNSISALSSASLQENSAEAYVNLWGVPSQVTISDPVATVTNEYNLSSLGLGHSDVWQWYQDNVIPRLKIDAPPPVPPPPGGPSPPPSTTLDISELLFPAFVDDQRVADSLAGDLDAAINDLSQENQSQGISDLEAFDTAIDAAPTADFPDGSFSLLSTSQNLIDDLGPGPSTTANTIYWTGDAGPDAVGNYNWDEAGNWSTVDPMVDNVPQDILPGPLDHVVVDRPGANIVHDDDIDDTISSLTFTAPNAYLNLDGGTLDLSGSGAPGTFQVPGSVNFAKEDYGSVYLNGGVLANAIVSANTAIGVLGSPTFAAAEQYAAEIDGGVMNGTIEVNDGGYAVLDLEGNWVNNGTITVNSSNLNLGDDLNVASNDPNAASDAWVNNGTISTNNCVVELGGWLTYDPSVNNLATLNLSTDTVYLNGTLDNTNQTLTLSAGVTSSTGSWYLLGGRIDGGTIAGSALLANGGGTLDGVTNDGTIDVSNSYPVTFQGAWANAGTISIASGAVVNLAGTFTTDTYDNIAIAAGATVNVTGTLDNSEADNPQSEGTLALGDSTGPLLLDGGTILQGDITTSGTNDLVATLQGGTLDGVTLDGTLDMTQYPGSFTTEQFKGASLTVLNGLTVNGLIKLGGASGTSNAGDLLFGSPNDNIAQTIDGSGTIQFGQDNAGDVLLDASNDPLTFGQGLTVEGGLHSYIESAAGIVNLGKITNPGGGSLGIQADLTNSGTIDAGTGTLTITNYTQTSAGVLAIEIGGLSKFGKLAVAGNAALGGTLNIALVNGYVPNNLDTFAILTYGQVIGDFAETLGLGAGGDNYFSPDYNMTAPLTLTLTVTNNGNTPNPVIYWTGDAGDDNWDDPGNWSTDDPLVSNVPQSVPPGPFDNIVIDLSHQTINHAAADYELISNLTVSGQYVTLNLSGGTLDLSGGGDPLDLSIGGQSMFQVDKTGDIVNLQGIDLKNAIITSGTTLTAANADSVLDNVTLDGTLDMTQYNDAYVQMIDAATINGTVELGGNANYASLYFGYENDAFGMTVAGTGTIQFGQADNYTDNLYNLGAGALTFGKGITIQGGQSSSILYYYTASGPIDNQGTIEQNTAGGQLTINLTGWVNNGSILVSNGATATLEGFGWTNSKTGQITATDATLNLSGSWTNYGTITVDPSTLSLGSPTSVGPSDPSASSYYWSNQGTLSISKDSTVNLGGVITTDALNSLVAEGLVGPGITLTGVLDNSPADNPTSGGILALAAATGSVTLAGGTIYQGTITTSGSNDLVATGAGGTLDGVQLDGVLDMTRFSDATAYVTESLTLNGTIDLGGAAGTTHNASLNLDLGGPYSNAPETIDGTGVIQFGQDKSGDTLDYEGNGTITLGPNIMVQGGLLSYIDSYTAIDNQGTIEQDTNGGMLDIEDQSGFSNASSVTVGSGATFSTGTADYTQSAGTTTVAGTLIAANFYLDGGSLNGSGTVQANVINAATVSPGDAPGTLTVQGNYTQNSAGALDVALGGPIEYSQLAISGSATLDGTLNVSLLNGYTPNASDSFQILTFASESGDFAKEPSLDLGNGEFLTPAYHSGILTLIPAAATMWSGGGADNLWSDGSNWSSLAAPSPGESLVFQGSAQTTTKNDLPVGTSLESITLASPGFLLGGNAVTLASASTPVVTLSASSGTIQLPITLGSDATFAVTAPQGSLTDSGDIDNGGYNLTVDTSSSQASRLSGSISGTGGLIKTGSGEVVLSGTNSFSGGTQVQAGSLVIVAASAMPDGTSLTIGAGGTFVFDPSQAGASVSAAGVATSAPAATAVSETSTPSVTANAPVAASAFSTLSPFLERQVKNLSYVPAIPATSGTPSETPAPMSSVASDAVFKSYRSAINRTASSADIARSALPWAWLAANENFWNSTDQNKTTGSTVEALDEVLARIGV